MNIVIANIIALIASIILVLSGLLKEKNKIIIIQTLQIFLASISNIILNAYSGAVVSLFACVRNLLCYKGKLNIYRKIIISLLSTGFSLILDKAGFIKYIPLLGNIVYIFYMDKDIITFKYVSIFALVMWGIYDFYHLNISSGLFDIFGIITTSISLIKINKERKT